jgi:zinc transporter, ZIP family
MERVLAFSCAPPPYLVTEELLLEAHRTGEEPETPLTTAVFFIGFLAVLVLNMTL